jgi:hypothetical protein
MIIKIYNKYNIINFFTIFKTKEYDVKLTDFLYDKDNISYKFIDSFKENNQWFIFIKDDKLYASDNISIKSNDIYDSDFKLYNICNDKDFDDNYRNLDNMNILNSLDIFDDDTRNIIIKQCDEMINKYNYNKFIDDNMKVLLYTSDDSNDNIYALKFYPDINNMNKKLYEIYNVNDRIIFEDEKKAYLKLFDMLKYSIKTNDTYEYNNKYINYKNIYYTSLIVKESYIHKKLLDYSRNTEILFCKSLQYNRYMDSFDIYNDEKYQYIVSIDKENDEFLSKYQNNNKSNIYVHQEDIYIFTKDIYEKYGDKYKFRIL